MDKFRDNKIVDISHSEESVKLVSDAIKGFKIPVKVADLVIKTGLSVYNVEDGLEVLMKTHSCRLGVDKEGNLIYDFEFKTSKKWSWKNGIQKVKSFFRKGAVLTFKTWITFMLFGYFWIYFPVITVFLLPQFFFETIIGTLLLVLSGAVIFQLGGMAKAIFKGTFFDYWRKQEDTFLKKIGIRQKQQPKKWSEVKNDTQKGFFSGERLFSTEKTGFQWSFIKKAFRYVFGEDLYKKRDNLELEKKILTFISNNKNSITITELIAITGWNITKAETDMTKIFVKYHGKVTVTQQGAIIYYFPEIPTALIDDNAKSTFVWQNLLHLKHWNNNFIFENNAFTFFGFLILVASGAMSLFNLKIPVENLPSIFGLLNYHWFPFIFSISFFGITIFNKLFYENIYKNKLEQINEYALLLKEIFNSPNKLKFKDTPSFNKAILNLNGEFIHDSRGTIFCKFPYLERDLKAIKERSFTEIDNNSTRYKALLVHDSARYKLSGKAATVSEIPYADDFPKGEKKLLAESIISVEAPQRLKYYIKLSGNYAGFKLYLAASINLLLLIPIFYTLLASSFIGTLLLLIPFGFISVVTLRQLFNVFNTKILTLIKGKLTLNHLPFRLFKKKQTIPYKKITGVHIKPHGKGFYKLLLSTTFGSPITVIEFIKNRKLLEEIKYRIFGYMQR